MKPSDWNDEDKAIAREQARLGAIEAIEELRSQLSGAIFAKIIQMGLGWLLIESAKLLITHQGLIKG